MKKDSINILCATDDNYVPYCGIMLTSVFENNKDVAVNAYVLTDHPLCSSNRKKMEQLAKRYEQNIHFVLVDNNFVKNYPTKDMPYWSIAMYYRLYAEKLLPQTIDKILYLDCDIIVNGSLNELFNIDLEGKAVAAVADIYAFSDERQNNLSYPPTAGYFNSGVLLMNLSYWRELKIGEQCLKYLTANYDKLSANDQDVLNAVLWDKKVSLPLQYNYQIQFLSSYFFNLQTPDMQQEILKTFEHPLIVHFAYAIKPWSIMYYKKPFLSEWEYYQRISPWKHLCKSLSTRKPLNNFIKRFIMWPLGLMHYESGFIK